MLGFNGRSRLVGKTKIEYLHNLEYVIANLPGYIFWKDKNARYIGCNNNLANLLKLKENSEIFGKCDHDFDFIWGKELADQFITNDQSVMQTKEIHTCEYLLPIKRSDGNSLVVRTDKIPLYNEKDEVVGILAISIDITDQKLSEKITRISHTFVEDILYNLPGLIYWKNINSQYMGFNKNVVALSGLSRENLFGKTDNELNWGEKEAKQFQQDDQAVMEIGTVKITEHEIPIKRPDGNFMTVRTEKSRLYDREGNIAGVLGVAVDITDQKILEERLTKEKEKAERLNQDAFHNFEYIISRMPGYIYWKNTESQYMGCNNNLAKISHLAKPADIVGKMDEDFEWGKEQAEQFKRDDEKIMMTGETLTTEYELPIKRKDGHRLYVRTDKLPFYDKTGKVIGILGVGVDITDQKILEKSIIEEKEKAEIANKIKTEFVRNMEHDIRTPFNGVWGLSTILWEKETDLEKKELLGDIVSCAKELLDYCNGILDFSKIEANTMPVLSKKFDLIHLLNSVINIEKPAAKHKNLLLHFECDSNLPKIVIGDPYRLSRVLINLISNAVKFTHNGHIHVKAQIKTKENGKGIIQFIIEDTGIGFSQDKKEYIYEKFTRLLPSNQGVYKGLGLGLRIVKQFIEEMDGEVDVKSELGKGTVFYCTFPFKLPLTDDLAED